MTKVSVEVTGLEALERKLDPRQLIWPIAKDGLEELGKLGAMEARKAAGSFQRTGRMTGSIDHKVNVIPRPLWVVVRVAARAPDGLLYPALLEGSKKHGRKNWLLEAIRRAEKSIPGRIANGIVSGIEKAFGGA